MLTRTHILLTALTAFMLVAVACTSDNGESLDATTAPGSTSVPSSTTSPGSTTTPSSTDTSGTAAPVATTLPAAKFNGYDLDLSEGDFWEYRWSYVDGSCYRFSCSSDKDNGEFQVTLGTQREIEGVSVYELDISGKPAVTVEGENRSFAPPWSYLGVDGDRIVVSNGNTLVTLFDGGLGKWAGSGFFNARFDDDELVTARSGSMSGSSEIADWPGVQPGTWQFVGRADSQSECVIIAKYRVCPNEDTFSYTENEYYRAGIGPVAYQYRNSQSFDGLESSFSTTEWVALTASSLRGDVSTSAPVATAAPLATAAPFATPAIIRTPTPVPTAWAGPGITTTATAGPFVTPTAPPLATLPEPPDTSGLLPLYGPVDGTLQTDPDSNIIPDFSSGLSLDRGIVQVEFTNPNISEGRWSHGISFRQAEEEVFHSIYFTGTGGWGHFARAGSINSEVDLESGTVSSDLTQGGSNSVTLVFDKTEGQLFLNGEFVADLDLSTAGVLDPGDIRVMFALFLGDNLSGSQSAYSGFTVYPLP